MQKAGTLFTLLILLLLSAGCTPTENGTPTTAVDAIYTMAAETVVAELTLTAAANSPTPPSTATYIPAEKTATSVPTSIVPTATPLPTDTTTPEPTDTPKAIPTDEFCDNAAFVSDISVPDNTEMSPGQSFEKTWLIKNTGTCSWGENYSAIYGYPEDLNGQPRPIGMVVNPEETAEVKVVFTAPLATGDYESWWRMANEKGINFGEFFSVVIVVR